MMRELAVYVLRTFLQWLWIRSLRVLYRILDDPRTERVLVPVVRARGV